jgi:hypothetical protein
MESGNRICVFQPENAILRLDGPSTRSSSYVCNPDSRYIPVSRIAGWLAGSSPESCGDEPVHTFGNLRASSEVCARERPAADGLSSSPCALDARLSLTPVHPCLTRQGWPRLPNKDACMRPVSADTGHVPDTWWSEYCPPHPPNQPPEFGGRRAGRTAPACSCLLLLAPACSCLLLLAPACISYTCSCCLSGSCVPIGLLRAHRAPA